MELSFESGLLKISVGPKLKASLVLSVNCLPIIRGILPLALTSSRITSVFRLNFVIRNTKAVQRKIDKESTVTNGNYNFQLRPNINYTVNNRVNLIIYYDRVVNKPIVSNSFPRYSSSFGARLRLSLNQ